MAMGLVETERDRLIRQGLLTPFDNIEGFERKVKGGAAPAGPQPGHQQQQQLPPPPPRPRSTSQRGRKASAAATTAAAAAAAGGSAGGGAVDDQWTLLQRRAVQQPTEGSAAAAGGSGSGLLGVPLPAELAGSAHQVGRGGLPLPELLAKAARQAVEAAVDNRARTVLMQPGEVRARAWVCLCLGGWCNCMCV